ncbi:unnamed protein product [Didymodactylos carnosus]|uniref:RING-type domain-containing protein n=1 Tax=Didymodactylos carnosus TaxID=1234261 RepID=A0A8S2SSX9_9BILA|nr:unnamed protein product [Didymodactylos carnosus]CAF4218591.1 unnamed protein product [Didymodactylos carnosus]
MTLCAQCHERFVDPRQLQCGHSFCYICIKTKLISTELSIQCAKCDVQHIFRTRDELERSLVVDSFINEMVQYYLRRKANPKVVKSSENNHHQVIPLHTTSQKKQIAFAQPPCKICSKKSNYLFICDHCNEEICDKCMDKHRAEVTERINKKWLKCKQQFAINNELLSKAEKNITSVVNELKMIRITVEQRATDLINMIENERDNILERLDDHITPVKKNFKNDDIKQEYQSINENIAHILSIESSIQNLVNHLQRIDRFLDNLENKKDHIKTQEITIAYLSPPDFDSPAKLLGDLKFQVPSKLITTPLSTKNKYNERLSPKVQNTTSISNYQNLSSSTKPSIKKELDGFYNPKELASPIPPLRINWRLTPSQLQPNLKTDVQRLVQSTKRNSPITTNNGLHLPIVVKRPFSQMFTLVPNDMCVWSLKTSDIPHFLCLLDNNNRSYNIFICDEYGARVQIYSIQLPIDKYLPVYIRELELFKRNCRLTLESFTVYQTYIITYVRRFEQKANEEQKAPLIKAGIQILDRGENGRCSDIGGMIYVFGHNGTQVDGSYQSYPIRKLIADTSYDCLWGINSINNSLYYYSLPKTPEQITSYLKNMKIYLDFNETNDENEKFEPNHMAENQQTIGLVDRDSHTIRLYDKNTKELINTYKNTQQSWNISDMIILKDNNLLMTLTENKRNKQVIRKDSRYRQHSARKLIEISKNGKELREIEANTLNAMTIGPNDEIFLGFADKGERGLVQVYI